MGERPVSNEASLHPATLDATGATERVHGLGGGGPGGDQRQLELLEGLDAGLVVGLVGVDDGDRRLLDRDSAPHRAVER